MQRIISQNASNARPFASVRRVPVSVSPARSVRTQASGIPESIPNPLLGVGDDANKFTEAAKANLRTAQSSLQRVGFINFWLQLVLSVVSGIVLLFSVAFTPQACPYHVQ